MKNVEIKSEVSYGVKEVYLRTEVEIFLNKVSSAISAMDDNSFSDYGWRLDDSLILAEQRFAQIFDALERQGIYIFCRFYGDSLNYRDRGLMEVRVETQRRT